MRDHILEEAKKGVTFPPELKVNSPTYCLVTLIVPSPHVTV